jgi:hypothetical protein
MIDIFIVGRIEEMINNVCTAIAIPIRAIKVISN